jgi:hypothetical protein
MFDNVQSVSGHLAYYFRPSQQFMTSLIYQFQVLCSALNEDFPEHTSLRKHPGVCPGVIVATRGAEKGGTP